MLLTSYYIKNKTMQDVDCKSVRLAERIMLDRFYTDIEPYNILYSSGPCSFAIVNFT